MAHRELAPASDSDDLLISRIKQFVQVHAPPAIAADAMLSAEDFRRLGYNPRTLFQPASEADIAGAEAVLGFPLPPLLKRLLVDVSNGVAGFCYDIKGLKGGCGTNDGGTLIDIYRDFKVGGESENCEWKPGLLPFCDWGCCIYSCVDCNDAASRVYTFENSGISPEPYTLAGFFEMWLDGNIVRSQEDFELVAREILNPFTREKASISIRRRKRST